MGYDDEGVEVQTNRAIFVADRVIVTLPIGVLQAGAVHFDPPLPGEKQEAIATIGAGLLDKLFLHFPTIFWDRDVEVLDWVSDEYGRWGEWINIAAYTGKPVLLGFNAAGYPRKVDSWARRRNCRRCHACIADNLRSRHPRTHRLATLPLVVRSFRSLFVLIQCSWR